MTMMMMMMMTMIMMKTNDGMIPLHPHQRSTIGFAGNKLTFVHMAISVLSGNSVSVF